MRLTIAEDGLIRGGEINISLNDVADIYEANYSVRVDLGKKVFGKWIPIPGYSTSGTFRVPKRYLSESWLASQDFFVVDGVSFARVNADLYNVEGPGWSGGVELFRDGFDPVEFNEIMVRWREYTIRARRT